MATLTYSQALARIKELEKMNARADDLLERWIEHYVEYADYREMGVQIKFNQERFKPLNATLQEWKDRGDRLKNNKK